MRDTPTLTLSSLNGR